MYERNARVAGQFYPAQKNELLAYLTRHIQVSPTLQKAFGIMMPHAGYQYSGIPAAKVVSRVVIPDTIILLGPNHTGVGTDFSVMTEGKWKTPLGTIPIHEDYAALLLSTSHRLQSDVRAHINEHSLEVELPFLYYRNNHISIVPITIGTENRTYLHEVGTAIGSCMKGKNVLIVASTDMTHYEPEEVAKKKDHEALAAIIEMDEERLARVVHERNISMCGYVAVYTMLVAAKIMGATQAELVDYRTSGEVTGDTSEVVGYAGMIFV